MNIVNVISTANKQTDSMCILYVVDGVTLRWWFHAQAEFECMGGAPGLQTRLVQHRVTYTNEVKAIGVVNEESQ